MSIAVHCPACQYRFAVPDEFAGKRGKCPKCATIFVAGSNAPLTPGPAPAKAAPPVARAAAAQAIPQATPLPSPAPQRPAAPPARAVAGSPATTSTTMPEPAMKPISLPAAASVAERRARKKGASDTTKMIAIGAGGGIMLLALMIGMFLAFSGDDTEPPIAQNQAAKGNPAKRSRGAGAKEERGLFDRPQGPITIAAAPPRQATTMEETVEGIVKIETPGLAGTALGTGFIINEKGWVATNCHVVEDATDQTRVILKGSEYKVAGLVIKAPEHDMAIIKLAEQPFQLTVLDISYDQHPKLLTKVRAVGYPDDVFNITEGIVNNVTTMEGLNDSQRAFLTLGMKAAPHHLWLQHSAKISPGNSGGPLLNEENQVIGINTWVSTNIGVGYAGHINHLRDLIAQAPDTVTPFPKGVAVEIADADALYNLVFTAARVQGLVSHCNGFDWKPSTVEEFDAMAELAKLITIARMAPPGKLEKEMPDMKQATDQACEALSNLAWDAAQVAKVNEFAADAAGKPLHGIVFVATLVEPNARVAESQAVADRLQLEGSDQIVFAKGRNNRSLAKKDARLLVVGVSSGVVVGESTDEGMGKATQVITPGFSKVLP